jgi:hypothetical protein
MSSVLGRCRECWLAKGGSAGVRPGSVLSASRMEVVERELVLFRRLLRLLGVLFRASWLAATAVPSFILAGLRRPNGHTVMSGSWVRHAVRRAKTRKSAAWTGRACVRAECSRCRALAISTVG